MKNQIRLVLFIAFSANIISCSQISQGLSYAMDLQEILTEKYNSDEVEVTINNNTLIVSLIDNKFSGYSEPEKQQISEEIGKIASGLDNKPELSGGVVKFVSKGLDGAISTTTSDSKELMLTPQGNQ